MADMPALGLIPGRWDPVSKLMVTEDDEDFTLAIYCILPPDAAEQPLRQALRMRAEIRGLIDDTENWGVEGVENTYFSGSSISLGADVETRDFVMETIINFRATYRESF